MPSRIITKPMDFAEIQYIAHLMQVLKGEIVYNARGGFHRSNPHFIIHAKPKEIGEYQKYFERSGDLLRHYEIGGEGPFASIHNLFFKGMVCSY